MLANPFVRQRIEVLDPAADCATINRLLAAAVVSNGFRNALLVDPQSAVEMGFAGESFDLSSKALAMLMSIKASSLREFAARVHEELPSHLSTLM
jgi:hypothetical protein